MTAGGHMSGDSGNTATWFDKPMRWMQLTLAEDDPGNFDPEYWLDYFHRIKCNGVCLSAGGYIAYYPTDIPLHYRSAWLGDTDPFGALVEGCRRAGMVVLARTDPHAVHQPVRDHHPEWIAVGPDGNPRRHWETSTAWVTCALGEYNRTHMTAVHKEIVSRYDVDGIFSNRWTGSGMCYCDACRTGFREASGKDLPKSSNITDSVVKDYRSWRQGRLWDVYHLWDDAVQGASSRARFIPNSGGGALSDMDMSRLGRSVGTLFADRQARSGLAAAWSAGKNAKEFRATMGTKPVGGIFSGGIIDRHRWCDSIQSEAEIRTWVAEWVANGARPWFSKMSAGVHDDRSLKVVEDIYNWHHAFERYLRNERSLAEIAVVYSQQTATFYGGSAAQDRVEDHTLGAYQALVEARIPFDMVHDRLLAADLADRYKVLLLPNIAALSDEQCEAIRAYVQRGGSVVATHETSLYNEYGARRSDFGLSDLFGVRAQGAAEEDIKNSYLLLDSDPTTGKRHPVLSGLENASRIINGVSRIPVEATCDDFPHVLRLVPSYPNLPMEEMYPRPGVGGEDEIYLRELGSARVAYIPWDIDRTYWEVLDPEHGRLLSNTVNWAAGGDAPVVVSGPGIVDVTLWRQEESLTVHLVNLTNPMFMKGPIRELLPVGAQKVKIRLPEDVRVSGVRMLRTGETAEMLRTGEHLEVVVGEVVDFEVVAVDLDT